MQTTSYISMFIPSTASWTGLSGSTSFLNDPAELGMKTVAITDHGTMFGCIEFYEKAIKVKYKTHHRL